jgi:hypothetical protein
MATAQAQESSSANVKAKERPSALRSIIAGSTAGAVEIGMSVFCFTLALVPLRGLIDCEGRTGRGIRRLRDWERTGWERREGEKR